MPPFSRTIAIEIGAESVKVARLAERRGTIRAVQFGEQPLPTGYRWEVGGDHQLPARETVDEGAEGKADGDRGQEVCQQERAHPLRRLRPVEDVDRQGDDREPGTEPGGERREKEQPEAGRPVDELKLSARPGDHVRALRRPPCGREPRRGTRARQGSRP